MIDFNDLLLTNVNSIVSFRLFLFIILALLASLAIDAIFGELPGKIHPVVIIGSIIDFLKRVFIKIKNKTSGVFISISIILYIFYFICSFNVILLFILFIILLSSTYSVNMLLKTAVDVKNDLNESIEKARKSVSYLVSRNTDELTESFIVSAVIESLTENITDSYVAPVFYFFIFAALMLINPINNCLYYLLLIPMLYRASNTMDAMLGYKTDELIDIGYVPAKLDDILNYIPARISGILVVISAFILGLDAKNSFRVMMRDARKCPSPNSGYTMATTAGALNIQLIKKDTYILGDDNKVIVADDIEDAVKLAKLTIILFTIIIIIIFTLFYVIL